MKLFTRRCKGYLTFLLSLFLLFYLFINYVGPKSITSEALNQKEVFGLKPEPEKKKPQEIDPSVTDQEVPQLRPVLDQDNSTRLPKRYYAIDGNGRGSVNREVAKCSPELEVEVITSNLDRGDFTYFLDSVPPRVENSSPNHKRHYYMVYAMESEPHSGGGQSWINADFQMWYNLDMSFPEPATYFDVRSYLPDLLAKPSLELEAKSIDGLAPLVWILSNCNAFNRREKFVSKLMSLIGVDSYGFCLRNRETHTAQRMHGNVELYSKYKFVIAIENSNCEGYVTEKLVHAVASGSIPIVAGRNNKPNYLQFLPKGAYINVYDFKTVEDLVEHLKKVGSNRDEYNKYMWFRRAHNYTREELRLMTLPQLVALAKKVFNYEQEREFLDGLVLKEKSENKLCKIARYLNSNPADVVENEIRKHRKNRPSTSEACLPHGNLATDFNI